MHVPPRKPERPTQPFILMGIEVERLQVFLGLLAVGGELCRRSFSVLVRLTSSFPPGTCQVAPGHLGETSSRHVGLSLPSQGAALGKEVGQGPGFFGRQGEPSDCEGRGMFLEASVNVKPLKYLEGRKTKEAVIAM